MNLNALAFQAYFAARNSRIAGLIRGMPGVARNVRRIANAALPTGPTWVHVRAGISKGLWMRLNLPHEARIWRGEHEVAVQGAILAALSPEAVVYDIGAHAGSIALGAARAVQPKGCVVAFEADPDTANSLRENGLRNGLMNSIQVVECAVWSVSASSIPFRRGGSRRSHGAVEQPDPPIMLASGERIDVPSISLDDFIASGARAPQLVKIDVEGAEYEVLRGGSNLFRNQKPRIIAEVHHHRAKHQIESWLAENRYASHWMIPSERFPCYLFAWPKEFDGSDWMRRTQISA